MWHSYDMAIGIQRQAANKHFPPTSLTVFFLLFILNLNESLPTPVFTTHLVSQAQKLGMP